MLRKWEYDYATKHPTFNSITIFYKFSVDSKGLSFGVVGYKPKYFYCLTMELILNWWVHCILFVDSIEILVVWVVKRFHVYDLLMEMTYISTLSLHVLVHSS